MLNKAGIRELAYVVEVDAIEPIPGRDRVECARIGGWTCMVPKGSFKEGDPGIYFEIDSRVPIEKPEFEFCAKYKGHIKTQKFKTPDGQFWSQGLLMPASDFGWTVDYAQFAGDFAFIVDDKGVQHIPGDESAFLTEQLGVTYYEAEDNKRKAKVNPDARINAALSLHPRIAKKYGKFIKKNKIAKAIFLFVFGRKKPTSWPSEVKKTDEERIENRLWTLETEDIKWVATEKIDGSSSTYHLRRAKGLKKPEFFICSRNVVFDKPDKKNYYSDTIGSNIYIDIAEKYTIENKLQILLNEHPSAEWVTLQGEIFGNKVQKRDYGMKDQDFRAFNLIFSDTGRLGTIKMKEILDTVGIPSVPIANKEVTLPSTIENLREYVHSQPSMIDGGMREGIVFRTLDGADSFKCVDPAYLCKYHGG